MIQDSVPGGGPSFSAAASSSGPQVELLERLRRATLGEYEVLGELGAGGMATVYVAHDLALDRKVAIKVMSPMLLYGPGMVERFRREARTAAALSHPNIIPIYRVREAEGLLFFVMKLVQGTPLDAVIKELGPLPIPTVEAILAQVGSAVGYAHRHGIVHRDIKPGNILIDEEGWAVVTDFGIAKVIEADALTLTGMAVGTPTYMSPEQCEGGEITGASDQYSLGVVAYEMLAGRPPFRETTVVALMLAHATKQPPMLADVRADCPESLRRVVERMLAKNPAERWPSLEGAVSEIGARHLAHDDPSRTKLIEVAKTGVGRRIIAEVQTPRSPIPLGRTDETPAPPALSGRRARPAWLVAGGVLGGVAAAGLAALFLARPWAPDRPAAVTEPQVGNVLPPEPSAGKVAPEPPPVPVTSSTPARQRAVGPTVSRDRRAATPAEAGGVAPAVVPPPAVPPRTVVDTQPTPLVRPQVVVPPPAPVEPSPRPATDSPPALGDDRSAIEGVVQAFADALERGRLDEAVRLFPAMPAEQRQPLEEFYRDGGSLQADWKVTDVVITGATATLRIQGVTRFSRTARTRATVQQVSRRARLERGAGGWRLVALVN